MHDTFLFKKISDTLIELCQENRIKKITRIDVDVHHHSHVNSVSLKEHLLDTIPYLIDNNVEINVEVSEDVEELTALIRSIEGLYDEALSS